MVWFHQLYISYALQKGGYGAATMSQAEALAVKEPMNAKVLALDTIAEETQMSPTGLRVLYLDRGFPVPAVSQWMRKPRSGLDTNWTRYRRRTGMVDKVGRYSKGRTRAMLRTYLKEASHLI